MNRLILGFAMAVAALLVPISAQANILQFDALLSGLQEFSANASPGTGLGFVTLDDSLLKITVDESWSDLLAPATASHIHGPGAPGANAPVLFPFSGVPAATSGSIPEQVFSISSAQITELESGLFYFNVHSSVFPGGEIRGQIVPVPEPSTLALLGIGAIGLIGFGWRRARRTV